ncbi:MAG: glycosyltransferase family 4 protein [Nodosilinea sp.]
MKIAYATTYDVLDRASWPRRHLGLYGAGQKIAQLLQAEGAELDFLGPLTYRKTPVTRLKWQVYRWRQQSYYSGAEPSLAQSYARQLEAKLAQSQAELLLCPENAIPLASIHTPLPTVLWTDALLGSLVDFYPYLTNLCRETQHNLHRMEQSALDRCDRVILSSEWAAQSAVALYNLPRSKVRIIPRGASRARDFSQAELETIVQQRPATPCRLLLVGVQWERKGGPLALEVAQTLNQWGLETELWVVGCQPQVSGVLPKFVKPYGFIDRSTAAGEAQFDQLLTQAHFLILPTQADTFGIAISEASAAGVPGVASNVGGIATVLQAEVNGKAFPLDATAADYSQFILGYMQDYPRYRRLALSAWQRFNTHLSWEAAQRTAMGYLTELLGVSSGGLHKGSDD